MVSDKEQMELIKLEIDLIERQLKLSEEDRFKVRRLSWLYHQAA